MSDDIEVQEIRVAVVASHADAVGVAERIVRVLCPDEGHAGPCPIPWSIATVPADAAAYPELIEQVRIERADHRAVDPPP